MSRREDELSRDSLIVKIGLLRKIRFCEVFGDGEVEKDGDEGAL